MRLRILASVNERPNGFGFWNLDGGPWVWPGNLKANERVKCGVLLGQSRDGVKCFKD